MEDPTPPEQNPGKLTKSQKRNRARKNKKNRENAANEGQQQQMRDHLLSGIFAPGEGPKVHHLPNGKTSYEFGPNDLDPFLERVSQMYPEFDMDGPEDDDDPMSGMFDPGEGPSRGGPPDLETFLRRTAMFDEPEPEPEPERPHLLSGLVAPNNIPVPQPVPTADGEGYRYDRDEMANFIAKMREIYPEEPIIPPKRNYTTQEFIDLVSAPLPYEDSETYHMPDERYDMDMERYKEIERAKYSVGGEYKDSWFQGAKCVYVKSGIDIPMTQFKDPLNPSKVPYLGPLMLLKKNQDTFTVAEFPHNNQNTREVPHGDVQPCFNSTNETYPVEPPWESMEATKRMQQGEVFSCVKIINEGGKRSFYVNWKNCDPYWLSWFREEAFNVQELKDILKRSTGLE